MKNLATQAEWNYQGVVTAVCAGLSSAFGGSSEIPSQLGLIEAVENQRREESDEGKNSETGIRHFVKGAPDILDFFG